MRENEIMIENKTRIEMERMIVRRRMKKEEIGDDSTILLLIN